MANQWHPYDWPNLEPVSRIKAGDVVHNPVTRKDTPATRRLAAALDNALEARGLELDHTNTIIGFVQVKEL